MVLIGIVAAGCDGEAPAEPVPQPQPLEGSWEATSVRDGDVPGVLYVFDPTSVDGREVSAHFIVDSSRLVIERAGRYEHRVWVTQWLGDVGGPPVERTLRFFHGDFGEWSRDGAALRFESHWLMNHRMTGSFGTDGVLHMQHGFSHGDPPVAFRYGRCID
ncbi:MAG TPA: hypothetical protein VHG09_14730 [Longimicrobiales bacterium]|nr:hypothetical protein [Longimicrobiales bacterium]